jgi:hypothetical protein
MSRHPFWLDRPSGISCGCCLASIPLTNQISAERQSVSAVLLLIGPAGSAE